ncbi:hypothetical protein GWK47_043282 [Chionoecetes opilio]|uniref:Uncharacterized protein n=1 Tax=Chionoecetes opilio TaxID=41210 RepID=A0A8J4YM38_CHIOP|nr:hypothetical protein GWK47_043282 [Chionoecetes opilio]
MSQPSTQESAAPRGSAHKPEADDIPTPPLAAARSSQSLDRVSGRSAPPMSPGADTTTIEGGLQSPDLPFQLISSSAKECIGERPRSRRGFVSTETLEKIKENRAARLAVNRDQHKALSRRTRTLLGRDKESPDKSRGHKIVVGDPSL